MKALGLILVGLVLITACGNKDDNVNLTETSLFTRDGQPIYESPFGLAADPSVLIQNDTLFMYYSAEGGIAVVLSVDDGITWMRPNNSSEDFIALQRAVDYWDNTLETAEVIYDGTEFKMYYSGYREGESDNPNVENYEIGLAVSDDGITFSRIQESVDGPIISRDTANENTLDRHAMTSPGVVFENGTYYMVYAGWNVTDQWTGPNAGIRILGATSQDGITWTKRETPILVPSDVSFSPDVNEATLFKTEDGFWYIPFSTDKSIGITRSTSFTGPYEVFPEAIVAPEFDWDSEVTAPDGFVENGKMRLWFHGVKVEGETFWPWVIGQTEAKYPLNWNP